MSENILSEPVTDKFVVSTLVKTAAIKIQRLSAPKWKFASTKEALGDAADNHLLVVLQGQLSGKNTTLKAGDSVAVTANNPVELTTSDDATIWLSVSFNGTVGAGLFPSPDAQALKRLKDGVKYNPTGVKIEAVVETKDVRLERITADVASAAVGSCENPLNQFVLVMQGEAVLAVDDELTEPPTQGGVPTRAFGSQKFSMPYGHFLVIPANTRGHVDSTKDGATVMLSGYFGGDLKTG